MKTFKNKLIFRIIITVLGVIAGYLYWRYIGCASGTCPIKSKWYLSSLYGGVFAYLISGFFIKHRQIDNKKSNQKETK